MKNNKNKQFDTIVVGGGHAGIEAAYAAARMGCKTALITMRKDRVGHMPCNPSIGGIGKGHIVFEISAFGGLMPQLCTTTYLQAKMLNTRKGPAVQGLRLQIDKARYCQEALKALEETTNLTLIEDAITSLIISDNHIEGIVGESGCTYYAPTVILTTGTFLNGLVHVGQESREAGLYDAPPAKHLTESLKQHGLHVGRMKTGTPPRILKSSVDFSVMEEDNPQNELHYLFEFDEHPVTQTLACHITHTNEKAHQVIFDHAEESPMLSKKIKGTEPRYCPSIESKVLRFSHKTAHHVFVEPEGLDSDEIYPNGISNSLPLHAQEQLVRHIRGFENAVITKPAYAIEYDIVLPHQLKHTLETKKISGLFCAGQINGTTGYEEAAGQGLIAGINAACSIKNKPAFTVSRSEGYLGIMIDDIVTLGVDEPYRMFTSRAERRLLLRQDNAFSRLGGYAHDLGLISDAFYGKIKQETEFVESILNDLERNKHLPRLTQLISEGNQEEAKKFLMQATDNNIKPSQRVFNRIYAEILYGPYKQRELREIAKHEQYKNLSIPGNLTFKNMSGLSVELQEKLIRHKPETIAQAALIPGMTPAAISLLIFKIREQQKN